MGILDGIVEWIAEQIMYGLDMINTSVLGALGCDMNTFLRYFPAAETMYSLLVALAIGLILLGWVWNLFKNYGLGLGVDAEDPVLPLIQHGEDGLRVIARRKVVPGAVVQQVAQQHQAASSLPLHQVQQLPAVQGAAVDV